MLTYRFNLPHKCFEEAEACQYNYQLLSLLQLEDKRSEDCVQHISVLDRFSRYENLYPGIKAYTLKNNGKVRLNWFPVFEDTFRFSKSTFSCFEEARDQMRGFLKKDNKLEIRHGKSSSPRFF